MQAVVQSDEEELDITKAIRERGVADREAASTQVFAEKGVAQGMEEWVAGQGTVEESIAAGNVVEGGGVEEGVALAGEEIVREQIENCLHKLSPRVLQVTRIITDMSHCSNALLVTCITHTHKNRS